MINIQKEVQKIHNQYGMSEMSNYKIQLLCEQYAKEYHDSEIKKLNTAVVGRSEQLFTVCCVCGKRYRNPNKDSDTCYDCREPHCK